ncbi:MAG TPA: glycoside hydrolase family 15 protein [Myxococcaceae bacterium]|nr:glycoside hydrolase family 15 protein [Myxococcaceae bacterium]
MRAITSTEPARIAEYGIIGDGRSAALVSRRGAIDWLCWPRFDSPSLFGALLDPEGGTWALAPAGVAQARRRYLRYTNVLFTRWHASEGDLDVHEWMPVATEEEKRRQLWPEHAVIRAATCTRGSVELAMRLDPRPDYGRRPTRLRQHHALGLRAEAPGALLTLQTNRPLEQIGADRWRARLEAGQSLVLVLTLSTEAPAVLPPPEPFARATLESSIRWCRAWASRAQYDGPYREMVVRSALAVKLLTYAPSGAIVAAPTTSLPERMGGDMNWDYRFCWVRDSALTIRALLSLGYEEEAEAFVSWLLHTTRLTRPEMGVLYDVYGRPPRREEVLEHWSGFGRSRPVRLHNAASEQLQLDSYGEVIDAVTQLVRAGWRFDGEVTRMLRDFGEFVCRNWMLPDRGIWEEREAPQHFTHSKALCWVALERLLELSGQYGLRGLPRKEFEENRDQLRSAIEGSGWNGRLGSYVRTLGGEALDASVLLLGWYGFERPNSSRMRDTVRTLQRGLSAGPGLIYRAEWSPVFFREGAFVICSFWLAEVLARGAGTLAEAEWVFQRAAAYANDLGLLAEEVEPATGEALGNFPQAFSHVGLIGAACSLEERRREELSPAERPAPHPEAEVSL